MKLLLFFFSLCISLCAEHIVKTPERAVQGETVQYKIMADSEIKLGALPKVPGLTWGGQSKGSHTSWVNGTYRQIHQLGLSFQIKRQGKFTIPEIKVTIDEKQETLASRSILITRDPKADWISFKALYNGQTAIPKTLYLGEELNLTLEYSIDNKRDFQLAESSITPQLTFEPNATLKNFSPNSARPQNFKKFSNDYPFQQKLTVDALGNEKENIIYHSGFSASKTGPLSFQIQQKFIFTSGQSFFNQNQSVVANDFQSPTIEILPLPPTPQNCIDLDLIGDWQVSTSLDKNEIKTGYPVLLKINISGQGNISRLRVPESKEFELAGFDLRNPELKTTMKGGKKQVTIEYVLIPHSSQSQLPVMKLSTFDPKKGEYRIVTEQQNLKIIGGQPQQNQVQQVAPLITKVPVAEPKVEDKAPEEVSETKKKDPLQDIPVTPIIAIIAFIFLFWLLSTLMKLKTRHEPSIKAQRRAVIKALKSKKTDQSILDSELLPYLRRLRGKEGALDELLIDLENEDLKIELQKIVDSAFMPGQELKIDRSTLAQKL